MKKNDFCPQELFSCSNSESCSVDLKRKIFRQYFGGFGFKFGHNGFFQGPGNPKVNEQGGWYQKLKEFFYYQRENLRKVIKYIEELFLEDEECPTLNPFNDFEY